MVLEEIVVLLFVAVAVANGNDGNGGQVVLWMKIVAMPVVFVMHFEVAVFAEVLKMRWWLLL